MAVAGPISVVCEICQYAVAAAAVALVITSVRRLIMHQFHANNVLQHCHKQTNRLHCFDIVPVVQFRPTCVCDLEQSFNLVTRVALGLYSSLASCNKYMLRYCIQKSLQLFKSPSVLLKVISNISVIPFNTLFSGVDTGGSGGSMNRGPRAPLGPSAEPQKFMQWPNLLMTTI